MSKFLYFADSATAQYIVPVDRFLGGDDTDADTIVLNFEDMNGSTGDVSQVTIDVTSGTAKTVLTAICNAVATQGGKNQVIVVADDVNSLYVDSNITGVTGIAHNVTSAASGLSLGGDVTATAAAIDFDLIDNNASALSFDAAGQAGILALVTTDSSEGVTMSGTLDVAGELEYTAASNETVDAGNGGGSATALSTSKLVSFVSTDTSKTHVSLADGTIGQIKYIVHKALANTQSLVITPANFTAGSTLTSDAAGRVCALIFDGTNWNVMGDVAEFVIA